MNHGDLFEMHARERLGMPPEWRAFRFATYPPRGPRTFFEITGAVAPLVTRGPGKGRPNWRKADKATERTAYIPAEEHDAWCRAWSERTGLCLACLGKGERVVSSHVEFGKRTEVCRSCGGTGQRCQAPAEASS